VQALSRSLDLALDRQLVIGRHPTSIPHTRPACALFTSCRCPHTPLSARSVRPCRIVCALACADRWGWCALKRRGAPAPSECHRMSRVYRCNRRPTVRADDFRSRIERTLTGSNQPCDGLCTVHPQFLHACRCCRVRTRGQLNVRNCRCQPPVPWTQLFIVRRFRARRPGHWLLRTRVARVVAGLLRGRT
jgi:hypothetical protein